MNLLSKLSAAGAVAALAVLPLSSPASATTQSCADYVYTGTKVNLCHDFPGNADRDCPAVRFRVTLLTVGVDPWRLSRGGLTTVGCEDYPLKTVVSIPVTTKPTPEPSKTTVKPSPSASKTSTKPKPSTSSSAPGALAVTGTPTAAIAVIGGGVVLVGGVALLLTRRRRVGFRA